MTIFQLVYQATALVLLKAKPVNLMLVALSASTVIRHPRPVLNKSQKEIAQNLLNVLTIYYVIKENAHLFPIAFGTEIDKEDVDFHEFKCKLSHYGLDFKCVSLVQEEAGDKDGFVECKYGETCKYKIGGSESTKPCDCGFNSDGKGYCPLGFNKRKELLTKAYAKKASLFKNTCHSVSRAFCYQNVDTARGFALDFKILKKLIVFIMLSLVLICFKWKLCELLNYGCCSFDIIINLKI
jgi:hypothetical protein